MVSYTILLAIQQTFANPSRRLELRYRPQDPFCHSLCGNRFSSSNLILRVRRRVRKNAPKDVEIHMDILGVIGTTYKFQGLIWLCNHWLCGVSSFVRNLICVLFVWCGYCLQGWQTFSALLCIQKVEKWHLCMTKLFSAKSRTKRSLSRTCLTFCPRPSSHA